MERLGTEGTRPGRRVQLRIHVSAGAGRIPFVAKAVAVVAIIASIAFAWIAIGLLAAAIAILVAAAALVGAISSRRRPTPRGRGEIVIDRRRDLEGRHEDS